MQVIGKKEIIEKFLNTNLFVKLGSFDIFKILVINHIYFLPTI